VCYSDLALASTGEQKALLVGTILAHAVLIAETRGFPPILLLDEPAVHLDPDRRAALFGALIGLVLVVELIMAGSVWVLKPAALAAKAHATPAGVTNTEALGRILYTDYVYYFQIAGLVLLVAMIGAIVLTLRSRPGVRRQIISVQNARTAAMAVDMVEIRPGQGAQREGA